VNGFTIDGERILALDDRRAETVRTALLYARNRCERAKEELELFPHFTELAAYYARQMASIDGLIEDLA